jgi:tRNA (guanine-N7-)-methyltransferase
VSQSGSADHAPRADLSTHEPHGVLRPGIRTYKPRRTRITPRATRALSEQSAFLLRLSAEPLDVESIWGADTPVIVDIGFGDGLATAQMAAADPAVGVLAIDVHTPGVGDLLARIGEMGLTNVRVMEADALGVLKRMIPEHSLTGLRSYFPDPWPKAKHHKRRLVQPDVVDLAASRLRAGGSWHIATDWTEYAEAIRAWFDADPRWSGGRIERPDWRPVTRYERRALRDGRPITDLVYRLTGSS